ncbi:hypothetical protein BOX15_Mlig033248g4 [Macrostomum lignano]|uniref:RRM domain-containing protein n=2 Tax=Macrostomum lignano TaxID=282301 RepID=A0A267DZQ8_9PLAT|nr:hypothetical protein BOX15_Mlig033248g4 [Macrostomum lignano]
MTAASSNSGDDVSCSNWEQNGEICRGSGYGKVVSVAAAAAAAAAAAQQLPFCFVPPFTSLEQRAKLDSAKRFVTELNIRAVIAKQATLQMQQPQAQPQQPQAKPPRQPITMLCRIYVGNIGYDIDEDGVRVAFSPFGSIKAVEMGWDATRTKHKGFAFVEYELPEAAALAIAGMNGAPLGMRSIRVSRPNNVTDASQVIDEMIKESNLQNWLYVANVRRDLSEGDLRLVFEAFGSVLQCVLAPATEAEAANGDKHRGFGYLQYETAQEATESMKNMKTFDLGGQVLRVGRAATAPEKSVPHLLREPPPPKNNNADQSESSSTTATNCQTEAESAACSLKSGAAQILSADNSVAQGNGDSGS